MLRSIYSVPVFFVILVSVVGGPAVAQDRSPIVVELFTSQGCPACPPAEAYMRELAERRDVIALEYHIDYYDYAGWIDPFGRAAFTRRWRDYARSMNARYDYTPFMVIGGRVHQIGSRRDLAEENIRAAGGMRVASPSLNMAAADGRLAIAVGEGEDGTPLDILLVTFEGRTETLITAGENAGRKAVNANVVRDLRPVGRWTGPPTELTVALEAMPRGSGCAVLLQHPGGGPIVAAAALAFDR